MCLFVSGDEERDSGPEDSAAEGAFVLQEDEVPRLRYGACSAPLGALSFRIALVVVYLCDQFPGESYSRLME